MLTFKVFVSRRQQDVFRRIKGDLKGRKDGDEQNWQLVLCLGVCMVVVCLCILGGCDGIFTCFIYAESITVKVVEKKSTNLVPVTRRLPITGLTGRRPGTRRWRCTRWWCLLRRPTRTTGRRWWIAWCGGIA